MSAKTNQIMPRIAAARIFVIAPMIALFAAVSVAQNTLPPSLDLETAVERAIAVNPRAKLPEAEIRIADAKLAEARSGKKPFVQFGQAFTRSNNPVFVFGSLLEQGRFGSANFALNALNNPSGLSNFRTAADVRMPLFDQRQTASRITRAENGRKQTEFQAESVRQQLRFEVVSGFYATILARAMLDVNRGAVASAEANLKKTRDMVDVGMTTDADFLAADVELANALQQKLEAESRLVTTTAELNLTLGEEADREHELTGDLRDIYFPIEEQDTLIRIAFENRPDYQRAELGMENSRVQTKSVRDQKLPAINAFGNLGYSSPYLANGSTDYTVGVSLTYTLFDAGRRARIEQSAAGETVAGLEKEILANQIRLEVIRALQNYKTARAKIQVSIKSIAQSEEALRIIQDRYKFGLTTFNEVLRAESALVRSKHDLLMMRFDHYISYAAVLLATGRLTDVRAFQ